MQIKLLQITSKLGIKFGGSSSSQEILEEILNQLNKLVGKYAKIQNVLLSKEHLHTQDEKVVVSKVLFVTNYALALYAFTLLILRACNPVGESSRESFFLFFEEDLLLAEF